MRCTADTAPTSFLAAVLPVFTNCQPRCGATLTFDQGSEMAPAHRGIVARPARSAGMIVRSAHNAAEEHLIMTSAC